MDDAMEGDWSSGSSDIETESKKNWLRTYQAAKTQAANETRRRSNAEAATCTFDPLAGSGGSAVPLLTSMMGECRGSASTHAAARVRQAPKDRGGEGCRLCGDPSHVPTKRSRSCPVQCWISGGSPAPADKNAARRLHQWKHGRTGLAPTATDARRLAHLRQQQRSQARLDGLDESLLAVMAAVQGLANATSWAQPGINGGSSGGDQLANLFTPEALMAVGLILDEVVQGALGAGQHAERAAEQEHMQS